LRQHAFIVLEWAGSGLSRNAFIGVNWGLHGMIATCLNENLDEVLLFFEIEQSIHIDVTIGLNQKFIESKPVSTSLKTLPPMSVTSSF
jgi:hypothetical protein